MSVEQFLERGKGVIRQTIEAGHNVHPFLHIHLDPNIVIVMEFKAKNQDAETA